MLAGLDKLDKTFYRCGATSTHPIHHPNPGNSTISQMAERIKELEAKREQYRAQMEEMAKLIEEQNAHMAAKDFMVEARFRKLEAMIFQSTSSGSMLDVTQYRTPPNRGNAIFVLFLFFFC
jgi:hypothetical protein